MAGETGLLGGLAALSQLGLDPNSLQALQGLVGQLGPSEEDKRAARKQAAIMAGLGMLGARRGFLPQDLSRAAMLGVQDYSQNLKEQGQQRMQAIGQAAALLPMLQRTDAMRMFDMGQAAPPANYAPYAGQGMGDRGTGTVVPPSVPPGSPLVEAMRNAGISDAEIALIARSQNPQAEALKALAEYRKPILGQNKVPMFRTREGVASVLPSDALANTAAMTGVETAAQQAAQSQFNLVDVPIGNGQTRKMTQADAIRFLSQQQNPASIVPPPPNMAAPASIAPPQQGAEPPPIMGANLSPRDRQIAQQDYATRNAPQPPAVGGMGGPGVTASPTAMRAVEKQQDITAGGQTALNTDWITNSYRPAIQQANLARVSNAQLKSFDALPIQDRTGWGTPAIAKAAQILSGMNMAPAEVEKFASSAELFNQTVFMKNWELLQQQKGVQTEGDSQRALKVFAELGKRPDTNRFISDFAKARNNLAIKQAEFYNSHLSEAKQTGDYSAVEQAWQQVQPSLWDDPAMQKWKSYGNAKAGGVGKVYRFDAQGNPL